MGVFVIISKAATNPKLDRVIEEKFPNDSYKFSSGHWLVSSEGPTAKVAEDIGITDKEKGLGSAVVLSVGSYWGIYSTDLWDWLKVKLESSSG